MKKLYVEKKEEVLTTSEPTRFCGFVDDKGDKGHLVYVGDSKFKAVCFESTANYTNSIYGDSLFSTVSDFVEKINKNSAITNIHCVEKIYFFDSLKELYSWLIED